jgi:hypothetical protein
MLALSHCMIVVPALEDNATRTGNGRDQTDVMGPDSNDAGRWAVCTSTKGCPFSSAIVSSVSYAEFMPKPPAAPVARARIRKITVRIDRMMFRF